MKRPDLVGVQGDGLAFLVAVVGGAGSGGGEQQGEERETETETETEALRHCCTDDRGQRESKKNRERESLTFKLKECMKRIRGFLCLGLIE